MNRVGIVCALDQEARHLGPATQRGPLGSLADGTLVSISGMGPEAASQGARALVAAGAAALATWGMAGGLDPALTAGDILLPDRVTGGDGSLRETVAGWRERLSAAISAKHAVTGGTLLTRAAVVACAAEKAALFRSTGAAAVDMESLAVATVADQHHLPFIAVRVIVDRADDDLPGIVTRAADQAGRLRIGRVLSGLMRAPSQLAPLVRLSRRYRAARRSMSAVGPLAATGAYAFSDSPLRGLS
ncbi:MAG TPA: hypothetical protein VLX90_11970 [Steroidobacteraceae bacterium]|nr:hypothetical protein [Steroidobacteraceae bacterium]